MKTNQTWAGLAAALDASRQTIWRWRKLPGAPTTPDLKQWADFVQDNDLGPKDDPETAALRSEKLKREIALLDIRLTRERSQVLPVEDVDILLRRIADGQRRELLEWAKTHTPTIKPGADLAEIRANQVETAHRLCDQMETGLTRWLTPATTTASS